MLRLIKAPTARDGQITVGPSDIGNPCERCLGLTLAGKLLDGPRAPSDHFSLKAWTGTAVHKYLEHLISKDSWKGARQEYRVTVGKIKKYGVITGSTDLYSKPHATALDFTTADVAAIRQMRRSGVVSEKYRKQVHTYGMGIENEGLPVTEVCIFFIPRDSNSAREIWWFIESYDRDIAVDALRRAEHLWLEFVRKGKVELLQSDPSCYSCNAYRRDVVFKD